MFDIGNVLGLVGPQAASSSKASSQICGQIQSLLRDETVQVISTLQLNQFASLTYHESQSGDPDLSEVIFESIGEVLSKATNVLTTTPLSLTKALVLTKHLLLYGSEQALPEAVFLGKHIDFLSKDYNTVLLQQQQQGAAGMFLRIKGGGVDHGGPVRQAAADALKLMTNRNFLMEQRNTMADPNSLVPVGSTETAAFVSDEVRLYALKKRIAEEQRQLQKSNLAKANNSFGGGYTSKDGKAVVGAAHGLDEMLKLQEREQRAFSDNKKNQPGFGDYVAPTMAGDTTADVANPMMSTGFAQQHMPPPPADLLDFGGGAENSAQPLPEQAPDLLDMGGSTPAPAPAPAPESDLFASDNIMGTGEGDIFSATLGAPKAKNVSAPIAAHQPPADAADLLGVLSLDVPVQPVSQMPSMSYSQSAVLPGHIMPSLQIGQQLQSMPGAPPMAFAQPPTMPQHQPPRPPPGNGIMSQSQMTMNGGFPSGTSDDRFAALDALASNPSSTATSEQPSWAGQPSMNPPMGSAGNGLAMPNASVNTIATPTFQNSSLSASQGWNMSSSTNAVSSGDDDNGFVMGGAMGSGLAPAPGAPPPPPPPGGNGW